MIIALISQNVSPGILIFRVDFIKHLLEQGHDVYAFALDYTVETKAQVRALGAIPVHYSLNKAGVNPFEDFKDIWALSRKIKAIAPDIVFSFFIKPSIYGTLAAKIAGVPRRIAMLEGLGYIYTPTKFGFSFKKRILQIIHGLLCTVGYAAADKVLFLNSDDLFDLSRKSILKKRKLKVLGPIGLNLKEYFFSGVDITKTVRFIFIARLLAEKGIFEYLEAARLVKTRFPNVEFVVLGGLDYDNPTALTHEQLSSLVNEGVISYPGFVNNVNEWIANSHVFVLPSYREGFPRSTQEAMAVGRAVITTDVPGCRETLVNGVNGFLVPPWNIKLLAEKMIYLIENPDEIIRMGRESYYIAIKKFDVNEINHVLENILLSDK